MDKEVIIKKILVLVFLYGIVYTGSFLWIMPDILDDPFYRIYLFIFYTIGIIDTFIRPIETNIKEKGGFGVYIVILVVLYPYIMILAIIEQNTLYNWRNEIISTIGLILYLFATITILWARINIGKMGTAALIIRNNHTLVTSGLYKYIRHPMYAGSLFGVIGFGLVTQSPLTFLITLILHFVIYNQRSNYEEKILIEHFGDKYLEYASKTKKFIPFLI